MGEKKIKKINLDYPNCPDPSRSITDEYPVFFGTNGSSENPIFESVIFLAGHQH